MLERFKVDVEDFKRGFNDGATGEGSDLSDLTKKVLSPLVVLSRLVLFGFLLALPGLPFLPWGNSGAIALTLLAAAAASVPLESTRLPQLLRALAVMALVLRVRMMGPDPTSSIVLAGAFITVLATLAFKVPKVFGLVALYGGAMLILRGFGIDLSLDRERDLLLSQQEWTRDRAFTELMRLGAVFFLAGLLHFGGNEMRRAEERAKTAEKARDAAIADERARIARELHDVVSHHVTGMTLQAEAAAMTGDRQALGRVASAGREALTELRRMLGVLRHPGDDEPSNALDPQPGVEQLDELARRTTNGPAVRLERRGNVRALPAGVELCVYRIVQESLTNAAKHSDATKVDVTLTYGDAAIEVDVIDNGRPLVAARVGSSGLGLVGMRERVALLQGTLDTGPRPDGTGYRVHASLPVDA